MAEQNQLVVCTTCRLEGTDPAAPRDGLRLSQALHARGIAHDTQECFSACSRSCVITLRGADRWTYVQGHLDPETHLDDIIAMAGAYGETPDGVVPWRTRPEVMRKHTIARIPPLKV